MSEQYDMYLNEHINGVASAYRWLMDNIELEKYMSLSDALEMDQGQIWWHDQSKYSSEEYHAYDEYFYGDNAREKEDIDEFNKAWLHHIHNNSHHWQHWVLLEDDPENGTHYNCIEMPYQDVFEMIADWWSFSWKAGNLKEIFDWYESHKDVMKLHKKTRELVENVLSDIRKKLEEDDE